MLSTLENRRFREGDRVVVSLGSGEHTAEVVNAEDPAKLRVILDTGSEVWVGRRAVRIPETQEREQCKAER
jgi:hydrogenase maturation factor